jgi:broad specificity phosphatase PhoE
VTPKAATATIHLVRHAKAENRRRYEGDDRQRPLTPEGVRQAKGIAHRLAGERRVGRVLSSAAVRCTGTVAPLAEQLRLPLETLDSLMEGSDPLDALGDLLAAAGAGRPLVACSHGDVIFGILEALLRDVELAPSLGAPKASTWELDARGGKVVAARFVGAPQLSR